MVRDFLGREIHPGQTLVYAALAGHSADYGSEVGAYLAIAAVVAAAASTATSMYVQSEQADATEKYQRDA